MRIGRFEHTPSPLIVGLFLLFLSALLALGTWQMLRAAEKKTILAAAETALTAAPVAAFELQDFELAAEKHTQVTVSGTYLGEKQFLWDNRVHKGQAGFEVITPVRTPNGLVLLNRGWVPPGVSREDLPDVAVSVALQNAQIDVSGLFSRPSKGFLNGDSFDAAGQWPRVLQYFDYDAIAQALGEPVLPGVVQPQASGAASKAENLFVNESAFKPATKPTTKPAVSSADTSADESADKANGFYIANWEPTAAIGPVRHYGYAFQWYAMALALTVLFIVYNTKRIPLK